MKTRDAINASTPALQVSDSVEKALGLLMEHHVNHLPVVDDDFVGMVSSTDITAEIS